MGIRKVWVKRPGASATLVPLREDDLVDDVRDMILKRYGNSLGRSYDAPDVTIRVVPRGLSSRASPGAERVLGPEEHLSRILDGYYPGGQSVDEALIIDVPVRRTPKASPRAISHLQFQAPEDLRPGVGGEYFPPMPAMLSPRLPGTGPSRTGPPGGGGGRVEGGGGGGGAPGQPQPQHPPSMSVITTGHLPNLPSPGAVIRSRQHGRPRGIRTQTSSPTSLVEDPDMTANGMILGMFPFLLRRNDIII